MRHVCRVCGVVSDQPRCPAHRKGRRSSWSPNRNRTAQERFRREVLARDGERCRYIYPDGTRCPATSDLRACHIRPLREYADGDPAAFHVSEGVTLCRAHDRQTDRYAR